jgi:CheY-like chemotaxis protein
MRTKRVLVADENANSRELLRILLEHEGCEVSEASDGLQAVALARKTLPDLIFLDLNLPELDGYAAVREMRLDGRLKSRSIVAMTEVVRSNDRERTEEAGFTSYIAKPLVFSRVSGQLAELGLGRESNRVG